MGIGYSDKLVHVAAILFLIVILACGVIVTVIRRPRNGLAHVLCGGGLVLLGIIRSLLFLGQTVSEALLISLMLIGELSIAAGIFAAQPKWSPGQRQPLCLSSPLARFNLVSGIVVLAVLAAIGIGGMKLAGVMVGRVGTMHLVLLVGAIPALAAILYQAVRYSRLPRP